jgi:putative PIN family toxin of toxin-antitoxin system
MAKAVLDTNVVVSGLRNPHGTPATLLKLTESRAFRCYVSEAMLAEYDEVLRRPGLDLQPPLIARIMQMFRRSCTIVIPGKRLNITSDPDDNIFLECALEARADYVVTGNVRHFPSHFQDIRIVKPRQFLSILGAELR